MTGKEMYQLIDRLYPICRSITGDGVRETLSILREYIPLRIREVPTGTAVFDWTVPKEWNIRDAWIKNSLGERVVDFRESNLHVVSYSIPVRKKMGLSELKKHLHTIPDQPDRIPYRTSYYNETWGFCMSHRTVESLTEDNYEVCIDSSLTEGHLSYGELYLPGETEEEILVSSHVCHPSLCNDNLSAIACATALAAKFAASPRRYSLRFLFLPVTIGAITWLAENHENTRLIRHGLVCAGLGDRGTIHYKKSRNGSAEIDRAAQAVLRDFGDPFEIVEFSPYGYDERQFCSPGFDLPVGCLMRTPHGTYPEYHTSGDNLDFVTAEALEDSCRKLHAIVKVVNDNRTYTNTNPHCEPQLGRRGLYAHIGGTGAKEKQLALLWVLNLSDGRHSLLDIAERSGVPFERIRNAADMLLKYELLK